MVGKTAPGRPLGRTFSRRKSLFVRARWYSVAALLVAVAALAAALCFSGTPQLDDRAAWREACKLSGYSCFNTTRPFVVRAPLWGLLGRYRMGDTYILVNEAASGKLAYAVKVHEMVHYLQYKRKAWKYTKANSCQMEKDAFAVSNKVLRRLGETRGVVEWDSVRAFYGCA